MEPKLEAVLRNVEVEAEYQGTIYEQTAVLETEHNTIALFDGHTTVTQESVGKSCSFVVLVNPRENGIEIIDEARTGISEADEKISKWSYEFYGSIVELNVEDEWFREKHDDLLILDIGEGTVLVSPTDEMVDWINEGRLETGDFVRLSAARTDLVASSS